MSIPIEHFESQFSPVEWRSLGVLFAVAARVSLADGGYDDDELGLEGELLHGFWRARLDPQVHERLDSRPELASELLMLEHGDVLADLAAGGDLKRGLDVPAYLEAWIAGSAGDEERRRRAALAKGLLLEAIHVGVRIACVDGDLTSEEVTWLGEMIETLGVDVAEARVVCVAAAPALEAAFAALVPAEIGGALDEIVGTALIGDTIHEFRATPDAFRYARQGGGSPTELPARRVAVVRVLSAPSGPFVMFAEGLDAAHVVVSMTFLGEDATQKAIDVGFMLGARVFRGE